MTQSEEKNLPEKLSNDIISYILEEHLKPGDKLPNESILAEQMKAGRSSVREAMKLLASRNIVTIRQGSGTYISDTPGVVKDPLGFTFIEDKKKLMKDLLDIRILIEPSMAALAAAKAQPHEVLSIQSLYMQLKTLFHQKEDYTRQYLEFYAAIATSSKNLASPRVCAIISHSFFTSKEWAKMLFHSEFLEDYKSVTDAITAGDSIKAQDAVYLHLIRIRNILSHLSQ